MMDLSHERLRDADYNKRLRVLEILSEFVETEELHTQD